MANNDDMIFPHEKTLEQGGCMSLHIFLIQQCEQQQAETWDLRFSPDGKRHIFPSQFRQVQSRS